MLMRPRLHYSSPFSPIEDCNLRTRSPLVCSCVKKEKKNDDESKRTNMINMVADLLCHRIRTDCPGPFRNNGSPRGGFYFVQTLVTSALLNIHSDKYYLFHLICMRDLCYYINDI